MNLDESYRVLGLKPGASLQEARRSYYKLLKFFHPDRHQGSPGLLGKATEETKKLNLAYEHLCKMFGRARSARSEQPKQEKRSRAKAKNSGSAPASGQPFEIPSCGMKMNWIAPGRFVMGSPQGEAGRSDDEGPQREVTISRGFWLGAFAVTQEEWKAVAEEAVGEASDLRIEPSYFRGTRLPVEQVSWNDCEAWLRELNAMEEGRLPASFEYRLPTEAEWEFACRAGTTTRFHYGNSDEPLAEYAWYSGNSRSQTHPVGEKKANSWGLHDIHGNVWEWCGDWYGPLNGGKGGSVIDPTGPVWGTKRVMRGGSFGVAAARCRSAYRVWNEPKYRDYTLGFRVALAPVVER
jgi:formylglycine-generating enzyme required for sulfatase activity